MTQENHCPEKPQIIVDSSGPGGHTLAILNAAKSAMGQRVDAQSRI